MIGKRFPVNRAKDTGRAGEWLLLIALSAVVLIPIWAVQYLSMKDYWNHLLKARILLDYADPHMRFGDSYYLSLLPIPNSASTVLIAALMRFFEPMVAGKLFLSIYALGLPFSSRYLVRSAGVVAKPLEYVGFGLVYNPCLWGGYIDFCFAAVIAQFAIGYWLSTKGKAGMCVGLAYAALLVLTYFAHLWAAVVACGVTFVLALGEDRRRLLIWLGGAALIGALFLVYASGSGERLVLEYYSATYKISILRNFLSLPRVSGVAPGAVSLASAGALITLRFALVAVLFVLALRSRGPVFYAAVATAVLYLLLPAQLGRMYEPGQRTLVFIPSLLAAGVAFLPSRHTVRVLFAIVLAIPVIAAVATLHVWASKDPDLRAYRQVLSKIPPGKQVLHVVSLEPLPLSGPAKVLDSDIYTIETFFGANYNLYGGGFYLHTFTTGIVKVRESAAPFGPWFIMDSGFSWPQWLRVNIRRVEASFDYVVVVGPGSEVVPVLLRGYEFWCGERGVEVLRRRTDL